MRVRFLVTLMFLGLLVGCRQPPRVQVDDTPEITAVDVDSGIRVEPGLTTKFKVTIARKNLTDAVRVEMRDLPAGVSAKSVVIAARETVGEVELTADPGIAPGTTAGTRAFASAGEAKATSKPFAIRIAPPSITFTFDPPLVKMPAGQSRSVKVTFQRGREAFQGPLELTLTGLPKGVEWTKKGNGPEGGDLAVFVIKASDDAGEADIKAFVRAVGANETRGVAPLPVTVLGAPFALKIEPIRVKAAFGQTTKVKISATRKDYQGPIAIKLDNLPIGVKSKPLTFAAKQNTGEIDLFIAGDAVSADKAVDVRGSSDDARQASAKFDLRIEGRPFALQIVPARLDVVQGSNAMLKVVAVRAKDYTGPIALELRNLPKGIKASTFGIAAQGKDAEIEIAADDLAALGDSAGVQVVGTANVGGESREIRFDKLALRVLPVFSLNVTPPILNLVEGQKAMLKVTAERRTYKGTITVDLRNLPKGVTAAKTDIPRDKTTIDIELTADPGTGGAKSSTHALGTTSTNKQVASAGFNVTVLGKLFDLQIDKLVKVTYGSTVPLRVTVQRLDYQGPIELELKNLPPSVKANKVTIPAGQSDVEIEVAAGLDAKEAKSEAHVVATAVTAGRRQRESNLATVQVLPGLFDLKIEPMIVKLHHGSSTKVKITAQRKGHDGPITVELRNLPAKMKAEKATIGKGETQTEIEIKADATVADGAKVDVFARGMPMGVVKNVDSTRFTVAVVSVGQPPNLELKVTPLTVQLKPGEAVKVKVIAVRKGYAGPIAVDLRNLPADVESSKAMIAEGMTEAEITLTAKAKAEPMLKTDVCAVGIALMSDNCPYASAQMTVRVLRK